MAAKTKAVAKRPKAGALTEAEEAALFEGHDEASADFGRDDVSIPRLVILQSNSPQVLKREGTYVEGAEPGMIYDTVGGDLFDGETGIVVIPIYYRHTYIEWVPRDEGGGFVADHGAAGKEMEATVDPETGLLPNGHQLVNTMEYILYRIDTEGAHQSILTFTSTQLRKGRNWNPNIMKPLGTIQHPPFYSRAWRLTTIPESNDKGNWFGWQIVFELRTSELPANGYKWCDVPEFVSAAADFRKLLVEDKIKFTPPTADAGAGGESADPKGF